MTDFVLVHGAWGGAFTWGSIAERLLSAGHRVLAPDLPGLGDRRGELHPGITLTDHVDDLAGKVAEAGFERFVLVGHSYGGMVITALAARLGARIDALVYVDAFLPADGQALWDIVGTWEHDAYIAGQRFTPGLVAPIFAGAPAEWRHPLLTLTEAVRLTGEEAKVPLHIYLFATGWQPTPFARFADAVKSDPAWQYHEVAASHDVMTDQPGQLLEVLIAAGATL
jgi:pimeloyl-ACP methyl ester carboxylesterase